MPRSDKDWFFLKKEILNTRPSDLKIKRLKFVDMHEAKWKILNLGYHAGVYYPLFDFILIDKNLKKDKMRDTILHELYHRKTKMRFFKSMFGLMTCAFAVGIILKMFNVEFFKFLLIALMIYPIFSFFFLTSMEEWEKETNDFVKSMR